MILNLKISISSIKKGLFYLVLAEDLFVTFCNMYNTVTDMVFHLKSNLVCGLILVYNS